MSTEDLIRLIGFILYVTFEVLLGSVFFCPLVCKYIKGVDIVKDSTDHNPGAFNAFELCGVKVGLLGLNLDILKGAAPVYIFIRLFPEYTNTFWMLLVMVAPVLGHALGVFNKFKGGKCIAVSFGVLIGAVPLTYSLFVLAVIYIISCLFKKVRDKIKSIATYSLFSVISIGLIFTPPSLPWVHIAGAVIGVIVVIKHLMNKDDDYLYEKKEEVLE